MGRSRRLSLLSIAAAVLAAAGCAEQLAPMRPDASPAATPAELAIVENPAGLTVVDSIKQGSRMLYLHRRDNPHYGKTQVELSPGNYTIAYHAMCNAMNPFGATSDVKLEGGHRYRAGHDCCYAWTEKHGCSFLLSAWGSYETFLWFEDLTTGEVVDGSRTVPATHIIQLTWPDGNPTSP